MSFEYNSDFSIENLSFRIEENSIYALTGNNGSGKTTLLRLLVGLLKPKNGTIKIFNEILTRNRHQLWKLRQKIGFLFQNPDDQLFAPTIREDIGFGARNLGLDESEVKDRVEWALEAVDLARYGNSSPYDLSWGQKKRAALAGLLVMNPKLLILDEPFANLDFKSIFNHLQIFKTLKKEQKMTILFTTHNLFFIENWANKMLVLNNGKAIFEGFPQEGLKKPIIKEVLGSYTELLSLIEKKS
ncbi:MAG: energy-coupling factor ABC transporter ATP-binding protein [Candidatus Hermodarchaeota archaeon]